MKIDPTNLDWRDGHELMMGSVVPRPIAFVSTIGKDGVFDVAPFSAFSTVSVKPTLICFTAGSRRDGQKKRTLLNIESSREFVVNIVTEAMAEAMNQSSAVYPYDVDKFKAAGLTPVKADIVKPPMVGESPINLECRVLEMHEFVAPPRRSSLIIGQVLLVHIKDECYQNGEIQMSKLKAIARMGGQFYCRTRDIFEIKRPQEI